MRTATARESPMAGDAGIAAVDVVDRRPVSPSLLWRLMARHDRVLVPVWLAVLILTCYASDAATPRRTAATCRGPQPQQRSTRVRGSWRCTDRSSTSRARANWP